jgi:hypothetical protein
MLTFILCEGTSRSKHGGAILSSFFLFYSGPTLVSTSSGSVDVSTTGMLGLFFH